MHGSKRLEKYLMREIVLDTETTSFDPLDGHRIAEIGAVELVNHSPADRTFHRCVCPEHSIPADAVAVHGLTAEFLADKPPFDHVADELLAPPRVTADDRNAHLAFVRTLGSEAIWLDYFTVRSAAA